MLAIAAVVGAVGGISPADAQQQQMMSVTVDTAALQPMANMLGKAQDPEEAYRLFARLASAAIGQAVSNALEQAVGGLNSMDSVSANSGIQGWERYLSNGLSIDLAWPTPKLEPVAQLPMMVFGNPANPMEQALGFDALEEAKGQDPAALGSVSVGISISGSF